MRFWGTHMGAPLQYLIVLGNYLCLCKQRTARVLSNPFLIDIHYKGLFVIIFREGLFTHKFKAVVRIIAMIACNIGPQEHIFIAA